MNLFVGSGVALITPFDDKGINFQVLDTLIEWHIEQGTDSLILSGTTGEATALNLEERTALYNHTVKRVNHRIPVIAGTGSNNTEQAIALSQLAEKCGVDGLLVVTPYYNKCTQAGLYAHYSAIANAVSIPILLYNVPTRTAVNLLPETVAKLSNIENIIGIKEASGDITQIVELFRMTDSAFSIYAGNDDHIFPMLALGACGVITTVGNIIPKRVHDLISEYNNGNVSVAKSIQFQINPLVKAVFSEVNPIPIKTAVRMMGFDVGDVRLPLTPAEKSTEDQLQIEMRKLGVIL